MCRYVDKLLRNPRRSTFFRERPRNTYEDAIYVKEDMFKIGIYSVSIVSNLYHMRRVSIVFKKVFKDIPISLTFSPSDNGKYNLDDWWFIDEIKLILSEYLKIICYLIRY
ncbi:MAG: ElyC/SanA/YdcF family protein [Planctomycetota bacterium]